MHGGCLSSKLIVTQHKPTTESGLLKLEANYKFPGNWETLTAIFQGVRFRIDA